MMSLQSLYADRISHIKPSAIRQIFALLARPDIISFAGGWPDPALFPTAELDEISTHILQTEPEKALQYGASTGDVRLLDWLVERMGDRYGMQIERENVMITSGSQQGIYLTSMLLLNPGDVVVTEAPTFVGAFGSMQTFQGRLVGVTMDDEGLDMDALEALLQAQPVKMVYVIPEFQNPSGRTMSVARRTRLIELAEQYNFVILEDAPYSDLRYEGEPMPTIYSLDPNGRTIYLGSFSKTLSPMRVGWMIASAELIRTMTPGKQAIDVNTPALTQSLIYHFCQRGLLDGQIAKISAAYKRKRDIMFEMLDRHMPPGVEWTVPEGGMFVWVTLPEQVDASELFYASVEAKVAFVIGSAFYPEADKAPSNALRLNFVTPSEDNMRIGLEQLCRLIAQRID